MRFPILLFTVVCVAGTSRPVFSFQTPFRFDRFTTAQGLSHNIVTSIAQDRQGFLWFGTEDGLNRYDGYSFRVYKHAPADTTSLRGSWITSLFAGKDGTLWVGASGLHRYDPLSDSFIRYDLVGSGPFRGEEESILAVAEDSAGTLWVGTTRGLFRMRSDRKTFRHYTHEPSDSGSLSANLILSLLSDQSGTLLVGTPAGLDRFDHTTDCFERSPKDFPAARFASGKPVQRIYQDRNAVFWLCIEERGLVRFDERSGKMLRYHAKGRPGYRLGTNLPSAVTEDAAGRIWVSHLSGVGLIDPSGKIIRSFQNDPGEVHSLSESRVYALMADRARGVWLGTAGGGVNHYDPQRNRFGLFQGSVFSKLGRGYPVYAVLEENNGSVWLGTPSGLEKLDRARATAIPASSLISGIGGFPLRDVLAIFQDREGFLWVGYRGKGELERIDVRRGNVRRYPFPPEVRSIFQDRDGEMWIGFWFEGVARLDAASGRYRVYRDRPAHPDSLHGGGVWAFHQDAEGRIWMGTWGAGGKLNIFDKSTGRFSRLPEGKANAEYKTGVNVRAIVEEPNGTVLLGTWGNGLQRYHPGTMSFQYFYEQQGLANNFIKAMVLDESSRLWISTERGISCLQLTTLRFRNFTTDDGLQGDMFLSGSAFRGPSKILYFGGEEGLNYFYPDSIRDDPVPPPVVITGFRIFDKEQRPSFWRGKTIELGYDRDFISFEFVGLDYKIPFRNRYAYILEGFDRDWVEAGSRRYAAYTHLDGGEYTFRVRASNSDGVWNMEGAAIRIRVHPPFWKAWWFMPGVVLFLVAAIFTGFRLWFRHRLALEGLRQRIARDLHDEVGTELSSIVLGSQYLARTLPLKDSDRLQIEKLGATAGNTHEMVRDIVWVLRSDNNTLDDLTLKMREVSNRLLTGKHYEFHAPSAGRVIRFHPEIKRNLFLFFKEALNNIIRHSGATTVEISVLPGEDSVELTINDNGTGFDEREPKTGTGLRNLQSRAAAMRATVSIRSNPGGGTSIHLRTPPT